MGKRIPGVVSTCVLLASLTGCTAASHKLLNQSGSTTTTAAIKKDGAIVSKTLMKITGETSDINIYKIFYMSQGVKVEEFVSIPRKNGKYPVVVNLHGGYAGPQPTISHYNFGYSAQSLAHAPDTQIIVEPEYQGYMESDGYVQDVQSNTKDVENAITSVMASGQVEPNDIYLIGYSLGGGIVLKVASERNDVKAVVSVSPFMGNDEIIKWLNDHPHENTPLMKQRRSVIPYWESIWGNYQTNSSGYKGVSIIDHISAIHSPVLILQGTGDQNVIWQTVSDVANQMKLEHKLVKFVLYPEGQHGLHDKYGQQSTQEIADWFDKYGLPTPTWW